MRAGPQRLLTIEPIDWNRPVAGPVGRPSGKALRTRDRVALIAFGLLLTAACAFHAAMSVLFVLPPNPLGESVRPLVLAYTHPLFEQYWNMFAPTPIEDDLAIFARTKPAGAADAAASRWVDISASLIADDRANPLALDSTLKNVQMMIAVAAADDKNFNRLLRPSDVAAIRDPRRRPVILEAMKQLAISVEPATAGAGEIQLELVGHQFPRFTHRAESDDVGRNMQKRVYPWFPIERGVAR